MIWLKIRLLITAPAGAFILWRLLMRIITFIAFVAMSCVCCGNVPYVATQACAPVVNACAPAYTQEFDACAPAATTLVPLSEPQIWFTYPVVVEQQYRLPVCKPIKAPKVRIEKTIIRERVIRPNPVYEHYRSITVPCEPTLYVPQACAPTF